MSILRSITTTPNEDFLDSFSNLRTAPPAFVADGQFTYDSQPLLYEAITNGAGATVAHDPVNHSTAFDFLATPAGGLAYLQSYDWHRYQAGRGQEVIITFFNFNPSLNVTKFARYGTTVDGLAFESTLGGKVFKIYTSTDAPDQTAAQGNWNIDNLDGTGRSGVTLDLSKTNILYIDFQALYAGRVRFGFDIDGLLYWAHEFNNANITAFPYIGNANLPIQVGMSCDDTATASSQFLCSCVLSRGGQDNIGGYAFSQGGSVTAASGARTHLLSLQPKPTFNSIVNRAKFVLEGIDIIVTTGTNPIRWELCVGDALTGTTAFNDVNATYSGTQFNTAGTTSGTPLIVIDSGYLAASVQARGAASLNVENRYSITLDAAGDPRLLGRLTLLVTGIGGTSPCQGSIKWREIR